MSFHSGMPHTPPCPAKRVQRFWKRACKNRMTAVRVTAAIEIGFGRKWLWRRFLRQVNSINLSIPEFERYTMQRRDDVLSSFSQWLGLNHIADQHQRYATIWFENRFLLATSWGQSVERKVELAR
jgi:hypothetical protein